MSDTPAELVIRPHTGPRDLFDVVTGLLVAIPSLGQLYGLPGLATYLISGSVTLGLIGAGVGGALLVLFVVPLFTVRAVTIDPDGLRFHRALGSPKFLPWKRITRIAEASRAEVIWWGWLLPPFPARESTRCLSSRYQYRIAWGRRRCYFPPQDPEQFVEAVSRFHQVEGHSFEPRPRERQQSQPQAEAIETGNPYQPPMS